MRKDESLQSKIMNKKHHPPQLRVDGLEEISKFDVAPTPSGFVFFEEGEKRF